MNPLIIDYNEIFSDHVIGRGLPDISTATQARFIELLQIGLVTKWSNWWQNC